MAGRVLGQCLSKKAAIGLVATGLEAADHLPEVLLHVLLHAQHPVQVVGHHLKRDELHLGVVLRNGAPALVHRLAEWREHHARRLVAVGSAVAVASQPAEQRPPSLDDECQHIHVRAVVVVDEAAPLHRRHLLFPEAFFVVHVMTKVAIFLESGKKILFSFALLPIFCNFVGKTKN